MLFGDLYFSEDDDSILQEEVEMLVGFCKYSELSQIVKLGAGAEGQVFSVVHQPTGKLMTMKTIAGSALPEEEKEENYIYQERFKIIVDQIKVQTPGINQIKAIVFTNDDP